MLLLSALMTLCAKPRLETPHPPPLGAGGGAPAFPVPLQPEISKVADNINITNSKLFLFIYFPPIYLK